MVMEEAWEECPGADPGPAAATAPTPAAAVFGPGSGGGKYAASYSATHGGWSVHRDATAIMPPTVTPARCKGTMLAMAHAWKGTAPSPVRR